MWNFIHYIHEDDCKLFSPFHWDLPHIAKFIKTRHTVNIQYHSYEIHGDFHYQINNERMEVSPIEPVKTESDLISDLITFTKTHYKPNQKNAMFLSSHCYKQFLRTFGTDISLEPWVEECVKNNIRFEFILFDGCYTATVDTMVQLKPITRYIVGCQSASPYLGYNTCTFADLFSDSNSTLDILKEVCNSYIHRNDTTKHQSLKFYTDSVILDLQHLDELLFMLKDRKFVRRVSARVEPSVEYEDLYDLTMMLGKCELLSLIIVYYKQSHELKKRYWGNRLHGLSVVL